jgi:cytochrome b involved in lipid metabolism
VEQFKELVFVEKRNLLLLDNQILDFKDYARFHPGGKFVLQKNLGRDISKFFYGSYKLVNLPNEI